MAQRTPSADTRGGRRKRRKKYKPAPPSGFLTSGRLHGRLPKPGLYPASEDSGIIPGLFIVKWLDTSSESVSSCDYVCEIHAGGACSRIRHSHCESPTYNATHSITSPDDKPNVRCGPPKWSAPVAKARIVIRRESVSLLTIWLALHGFLSSTNTNFAVQATVLRPQQQSFTSSLPQRRYSLLPVSTINESVFIFFNPPAIPRLKINTLQIVSFNFTVYTRKAPVGVIISNNRDNKHKYNNTITNTTVRDPSNKKVKIASLGHPYAIASTSINPTTKPNKSNRAELNLPFSSTPSTQSTSWNSTNSTPKSNISNNLAKNNQHKSRTYWVMVYSEDESVARPVITSSNRLARFYADSQGSYILMAVWPGRQYSFSVEARHIGRVTMSVAVVDTDGDKRMSQVSYVQAVAASQYPVTAVRGERVADLVFNIAAASIAIIISFGIGAVTDTDSVKRQLRYPVPLIVGFCCQFIVMPLMAFGLAMTLPLDKDVGFGLLCVSCVPGGGFGHVAVVIADGDPGLSLAMNLISAVAMLGTAPLWIFVLGQYFLADSHSILNPHVIPIYHFEVWLVCNFLAYAAGLTIKRMRPAVADAILMWFIKPFLLLACILYVTLGVYINMYVFELVDGAALLSAMLLPLNGCLMGAALAAVCRQSYAHMKTIALETCSLNCLIVMVALRFSLKQPDADLAAVTPIWVMFTIPGLFVVLAFCNKVKSIILMFWRNRGNKDSDAQSSSKAYSISSSMISPPGTTTLSAPLVTADGLDDDVTISSSSNQRVTVL
ncbi:unnamed protein product [Candidula unifasciata]|uniref:Uncharacterized protein n=1 Tax=Candidula unifasciata TaxID=100452 RepID=A0A8S3ZXI8_9EUPU|nr:unnamed protein product [Candidula unifasciata]